MRCVCTRCRAKIGLMVRLSGGESGWRKGATSDKDNADNPESEMSPHGFWWDSAEVWIPLEAAGCCLPSLPHPLPRQSQEHAGQRDAHYFLHRRRWSSTLKRLYHFYSFFLLNPHSFTMHLNDDFHIFRRCIDCPTDAPTCTCAAGLQCLTIAR